MQIEFFTNLNPGNPFNCSLTMLLNQGDYQSTSLPAILLDVVLFLATNCRYQNSHNCQSISVNVTMHQLHGAHIRSSSSMTPAKKKSQRVKPHHTFVLK